MLAFLALTALLPTLVLSAPLSKRSTYQLIYAGRDNLCLSVEGGINAVSSNSVDSGTPVVSMACNEASVWDINPGSGSIVVSGTNFALDAGTNPGDNGPLKVWQSYPGLYQQTWYLTGDNRIAITGGDQCLDEGDNGVQTYQCTTGNTNQVWFVETPTPRNDPTPKTTLASASPTTTASTGIPTGPVYQDPSPGNGRRIHPNGRSDLCVTVQNGYPGIGTEVAISGCFANEDEFAYLQLWDATIDASGPIKLHGQDLCLDAGISPADGSPITVYTCYDNLLQQTWDFSSDQTVSLSNGQCLDVQAGSQPGFQKPYNSLENLQTWSCSDNGDPQQNFFELAYSS